MTTLTQLYRPSLALLTDLYQLTMARGYWSLGLAEREAVFHLFFRKNPFRGGYAISCGLAAAADYLAALRFDDDDLRVLSELTGNDGGPLFPPGFLSYLSDMEFSCDIDAMPEGTVAFPHEPLIRVKGPLLQAQLVETALLNIVNFQTLIATKSSRICRAAAGDAVLEFGLRRAQGIDGGLAASRAAYVGGCAGTSNVWAAKLYGIPVKGTHAHSWVLVFDGEVEAFEAYASALPNNCVFLVDTYDTIEGVHRAVAVGRALRARGFEMVGVRLDSGDLSALSKGARQILDDAGFPDAAVVASNDLDEHRITALKADGAPIGVWGVGTRLVTAHDQPALGGVYKLSAIRDEDGAWQYRVKLSEQPIKVSNPGVLQVRRFTDAAGRWLGDAIYDEDTGPGTTLIDPMTGQTLAELPTDAAGADLLQPIFRGGQRVGAMESLTEIRTKAAAQIAAMPPEVARLSEPAHYPVGLEPRLQALKLALMDAARD